jgi:hypothetical protein
MLAPTGGCFVQECCEQRAILFVSGAGHL